MKRIHLCSSIKGILQTFISTPLLLSFLLFAFGTDATAISTALAAVSTPAPATGSKWPQLFAAASPEAVSAPGFLGGPTEGMVNENYSYLTGGSTSNLGHAVEYQFDWKGDGSDLSPWGPTTRTKAWAVVGDYKVKARARCAQDPSVVSGWSGSLSVSIRCVSPKPVPPSYLSPSNGETGVSTSPTLSWSGVANAISYDIYIGTTPSPDRFGNTTSTSISPPVLNPDTTYYWMIVPINKCGDFTGGPIWSFKTK